MVSPLSRIPVGTFLVLAVAAAGSADEKGGPIDAGTHARALAVLREGLTSDQFWPSMHAAEGLSIAGEDLRVIEYLTPRLPLEKDDQQRCGLARELVRAGKPENARVMLEILAGENDYGHVHAAESLYKVKQIGDGKALDRAFRQDKNKRLKLMAAGALAQFDRPDAMQYLREMLSDEDPQLYHVAAWILGVIGDESDVPRIRANIERAPDELMRAYQEHALALLGDESGKAALIRNLRSKDPLVRTYAANFAGDAGLVEAVPILAEMLDDPHLDARIRAAQAIVTLAKRK